MSSQQVRRIGRTMFLLGWIPFVGIFVGMIGMPNGSYSWVELPMITRVSMALVAFFFGGSMLLQVGAVVFGGISNTTLQETGRTADATILEISDTGTTVNENPVVHFVLDVRPGDYPAFQAETEMLISRLQIPMIQPGTVVVVKYDPDTQRVALAKDDNGNITLKSAE